VFRAGHELVLQLHAPPPSYPLSTYVWASAQPPAINTVLQDPLHRSSLLLPLLRGLPPISNTAPDCGALTGEPCFSSSSG